MGNSNYELNDIYQPGYSKFKPGEDSPYLGKQGMIPASEIGLTTDPRMANQIAALSTALNQGVSVMEIGTLSPQVFETIPKQHFAEMRRKAKLANAQLTFHAPIQGTDPSGFGQRGYEESNRLAVERQLKDVIDKIAVVDEKGNMPITIHGSNTAGSNWKYITDENGKRVKKQEMLVAVDKQTGQLTPLKEEIQYTPEGLMTEQGNFGKGVKMSPEEALRSHNSTKWRKDIDGVLFEKETADRILSEIYPIAGRDYLMIKSGQKKMKDYYPEQREQILKVQTADSHIHQAELLVQNIFDNAYQYGGKDEKEREEIRKELRNFSEEYERSLYGGYTLNELEKKEKRKRILPLQIEMI